MEHVDTKIIKRTIAYYSDFDTGLEGWKSEHEYISICDMTLQQLLSMLKFN